MMTKNVVTKPLETKNIKSENSNIDSQVKVKKQRAPKRTFTDAYKLQILNKLRACKTASERGALLRKEGLYYSRISAWKKQLQNGKFISKKNTKICFIKSATSA